MQVRCGHLLNHIKHMKKKFLIAIFIVCLYFMYVMGRGWYYYVKYDGENVPLILSTQFSPTPSSIYLYIDDNLCYANDSLQIMYEFVDLKLPFGFHSLRAHIDGEIFEESFFVFPVCWIYIEIQKYDVVNYKEDAGWIRIDFSNAPIGLM